MAEKGGSLSASYSPKPAASYVRRGAAAIRARSAGVGRPVGIRRAEFLALRDWASLNGALLPFDFIEQFKYIGSGAEHRVYHDQRENVAIKATHTNRFGHSTFGPGCQATPSEYLRRLAWCNRIFGDNFKILGVSIDEEEQVEIICSQPGITAHPIRSVPFQTEINNYFGRFGFARVPGAPDAPMFFHSELKLLVADAHDTNILRDSDGNFAAIDIVIGGVGEALRQELELP
jgi:hypothetical protein